MARVMCECGESFAPFSINGLPRTNCPFCKRELHLADDGSLVGTKPAPTPPSPRASAPSTLPRNSGAAASPSVSEGITKQFSESVQTAIASDFVATTSQPKARFANVMAIDAAVRQLSQFVSGERRKQKQPLTCPHQLCSNPVDCTRAFSCGALTTAGSDSSYVLWWTLGVSGGILAFNLVMVAIVSALGESTREPNYVMMGLIVAGLPVLGGVIAFCISSMAAGWQRQYVRAVAGACGEVGLQYLPLPTVPSRVAAEAFPVICPTPPQYGILGGLDRSIVKLLGTGVVEGQELHLAQFEFHFDPNDHATFGGAMKTLQTVVKPGTAFSRPETWQMYVLAFFPELLTGTSDFLVTPIARSFENTFIKRKFGPQTVSLPSSGGMSSYMLTSASGEPPARQLGEELLGLLASSPGWSVQLVGGRLMMWKGSFHPGFRFMLPRSRQEFRELIQFARQVRSALARQGRG